MLFISLFLRDARLMRSFRANMFEKYNKRVLRNVEEQLIESWKKIQKSCGKYKQKPVHFSGFN